MHYYQQLHCLIGNIVGISKYMSMSQGISMAWSKNFAYTGTFYTMYTMFLPQDINMPVGFNCLDNLFHTFASSLHQVAAISIQNSLTYVHCVKC